MSGTGRIAFVPPRYGPEVVGGAEQELSRFAHGLAARGWEVEVLTTCAVDHFTWANHHPAGVTTDGDPAHPVTVRRFETVVDTPGRDRAELSARLLAGATLTITEEQRWVNDSLRVPDLWHHVLDHGHEYRAIVLGPYMFWTTYAVGQIHPDRTILMPCLHDEPFARLRIYQSLFNGSRGLWFLSEPEAALAQELFSLPPRAAVVGLGVPLPESYDPDGFRARHGIDAPFVFFTGRREGAKSWPALRDAFLAFRRAVDTDLLLVSAGGGDPELEGVPADVIVDLGFISDRDRDDAMAAAAAYVQPSALESFSLTVLEAMAAGTPVIANEGSAVVAWHLDRSGAGVTYRNRNELIEALRLLDANPAAFATLAVDGRSYVEKHYDPDQVLDAAETTLQEWTS